MLEVVSGCGACAAVPRLNARHNLVPSFSQSRLDVSQNDMLDLVETHTAPKYHCNDCIGAAQYKCEAVLIEETSKHTTSLRT